MRAIDLKITQKSHHICDGFSMVGEGFEPSKALPTDLQSAPFGHSGTPPN